MRRKIYFALNLVVLRFSIKLKLQLKFLLVNFFYYFMRLYLYFPTIFFGNITRGRTQQDSHCCSILWHPETYTTISVCWSRESTNVWFPLSTCRAEEQPGSLSSRYHGNCALQRKRARSRALWVPRQQSFRCTPPCKCLCVWVN